VKERVFASWKNLLSHCEIKWDVGLDAHFLRLSGGNCEKQTQRKKTKA
jgi:hypothetical protein